MAAHTGTGLETVPKYEHERPVPNVPVGTALLFVTALHIHQERDIAAYHRHDEVIRGVLEQWQPPPHEPRVRVLLHSPQRYPRAWSLHP